MLMVNANLKEKMLRFQIPNELKDDLIYCQRTIKVFIKVHQVKAPIPLQNYPRKTRTHHLHPPPNYLVKVRVHGQPNNNCQLLAGLLCYFARSPQQCVPEACSSAGPTLPAYRSRQATTLAMTGSPCLAVRLPCFDRACFDRVTHDFSTPQVNSLLLPLFQLLASKLSNGLTQSQVSSSKVCCISRNHKQSRQLQAMHFEPVLLEVRER